MNYSSQLYSIFDVIAQSGVKIRKKDLHLMLKIIFNC